MRKDCLLWNIKKYHSFSLLRFLSWWLRCSAFLALQWNLLWESAVSPFILRSLLKWLLNRRKKIWLPNPILLRQPMKWFSSKKKTVLDVQHLDDGSSLTSYRKDVATILPSEFPTSISPYADGSINQDSWDSSNTVRAYTTIYYDIVKDSGDRSYYKLTKVTGKYYCNNSATKNYEPKL